MHYAVPHEIREALGMPHADLNAACERIRTLRHTEQLAGEVLSGRLRRGQEPKQATEKKGLALRIALTAAAAALVLALLLGWAAVVDQPQGGTWKSLFQSGGNVNQDTEMLLRAARRERAARIN